MTDVLYQRFDTPGLAARDRFAYWRDWCAQAIDVPMRLEPVRRCPDDFDASAEALAVGAVNFVEHRSGPVIGSWTRDATTAAERLRLMILAPAPGGGGFCHDQRFALDSGAAVLVGGSDGGWQTEQGLHGIQVNVPRYAIPVTDAQLTVLSDQRRLRRDPVFTALVGPALLGLAGHLGELAGSDVRELPALWISLVTMLVRSLAGRDTNGTDTTLARRHQAERYIHANLADPRLAPAMIADAMHISRSTLYAALPAGSRGIAAEIRDLRLARAHTMLCDLADRRPIAGIAAAVGFADPARFSRAFRDRYGVTPRQLRAEHPGGRDRRTRTDPAR